MEFRLLGFPVTIETSAFILAGVYFLFGLQRQDPMLENVAGVLVIFGSILWHEFGHALSAKAFGLGPISITLHGFGGLTQHARAGTAWRDLLVILAGPGAGLFLGMGALIAGLLVPMDGLLGAIWNQLVFVNIFWSLFNLLPIFPMDGGQALNAVLRMTFPSWAWPVTIWLGLGGGAALAALALYNGSFFMVMMAGTMIQNNWSLRQRWNAAMANRG